MPDLGTTIHMYLTFRDRYYNGETKSVPVNFKKKSTNVTFLFLAFVSYLGLRDASTTFRAYKI